MKVIVVTSQKGGSGKTSLVRNLGVAAEGAGYGPVALLDMDPQGTLTAWWNRREAEKPMLARAEPGDFGQVLEGLRANRVRLVLVDTPPSVHPFVASLIGFANVALVPVRPSPDDLGAVAPTVEMLETVGKRFAFVLTQVKPRSRLAAEAVRVLAGHGKVAPAVIHDRTEYPTAAITGAGVTESDPGGKAAAEVGELLAYVERLAHVSPARRKDASAEA